jgi:LacI family transcriptional regulator
MAGCWVQSLIPVFQSAMTQRISQADIAHAAGVHPTTVSLSLRNNPVIPAATRLRIQTIAAELGYRPDPALQALIAYRRSRMTGGRRDTVAYLTNWDTRWGWRQAPAHERFHAGAARKADELGYQLEHFWLGEPHISHGQLSRILAHRGISGVLLASHLTSCDRLLDFDWSRFSAVRIDCFPHYPALRHVTNDQRGIIRLVMRRIVDAGYRRIGLVMPRWWDGFVDLAWSAGFLAEQERLSSSDRIPLLLYDCPQTATDRKGEPSRPAVPMDQFDKWYRCHRPEVIVSYAPFVLPRLAELGLSVPDDVAYVDMFLNTLDGTMAGVYQNCEQVGEVAMELLASDLQHHIRGIPAVATATLVEGTWIDGSSLPAKPLNPKRAVLEQSA